MRKLHEYKLKWSKKQLIEEGEFKDEVINRLEHEVGHLREITELLRKMNTILEEKLNGTYP